jgi:tetratricopeptide (TPR) repeat protein
MLDEEYFKSEEFKEILEQYEAAEASGLGFYMDVDDLCDVADYYQSNNQYDAALHAIEKALDINPTATLPLVFKARDAINNGDFQTAQEYLDRIEDKTDMEYQYAVGELLIAQGEIDEADSRFLKIFNELDSDDQQDFLMDVASIYTDYEVPMMAVNWMMRSRGDTSEEFQELMARALFGLGKYDDSERIFKELIDRDPFQKRYWNALANTQFMKEDYNASVTSSEYAIAIDPEDAEGILSKANALYRLDNFEDALTYYERYNAKVADDAFGLLHEATCLISLGRYGYAINLLKEAELCADPCSPYLVDIYQELAFALSELHETDAALDYLNKTDTLECDHVDMLVIKGHVLLTNGRLKEAERMFKKAIIQSESSPHVILRILVSLYDNNYVNASYTMFKRFFLMVDKKFNDGYSYMALCCWHLQYYDEFMYYLRESVRRNHKEARMVLSSIFPEGMAPEDYYPYMVGKLGIKS